MAAAKIKKGDKVVVLSGKDKGKHRRSHAGRCRRTARSSSSGVNVAARHRKPTQANPQGGIERREAPMHISKVALADPKTGKPTRVRFEDARRQEGPRRRQVRGDDQWLMPNIPRA